MKREMVCTACPVGCRLTVTDEGGTIAVEGNQCPRGIKYGVAEATNPTRVVTSSIPVRGARVGMLSVRTAQPVPKEAVPAVLSAIRAASADAPVSVGQILIEDAAGTGVSVVATRKVEAEVPV